MAHKVPSPLLSEFRLVRERAALVWQLVPRELKWALSGATLLMMAMSAGGTAVAILLGKLVDGVKFGLGEGLARDAFYYSAAAILAWISVIYLSREAVHVLRRYLVDASCTRLNRDMQLRLVGHILQTDLGRLGHERVGAQHGKIFRSVDGLVRFV